MMMNLFSVFDPSTSLMFSLNWFSSLYLLFLMPMNFWLIPSRLNYFIFSLFNILLKEFKILMVTKLNYLNILMLISLLYFILINNFMGMFPYIFTNSSHLIYSMSLSLILWISMMLFGWLINSNKMFIHLVPQGTPSMLMPFMVLIESISNIIRPLTLSVRLSANMIAGHLLMTLISSTGNSLMLIFLISMLILQSLLVILELSVSIIQSYVFTVLSTLYSIESN